MYSYRNVSFWDDRRHQLNSFHLRRIFFSRLKRFYLVYVLNWEQEAFIQLSFYE